MADTWKGVKAVITSTRQKSLGLKMHLNKEQNPIDTLGKIQERKNKIIVNNNRTRADKFKTQATNSEANEQVKKCIRANMQKHKDLAITLENLQE